MGQIFVLVVFSQLLNSHELETTMLVSIRSPDLTDHIASLRWSNTRSFLSWANSHQLFTLWQKMLPPRRHLLPTPVLKTTLKPDAITLEKNERALLCKWYYCTIKLDTYVRKEFSWGKITKYWRQNSHSMYKIKHLTADWRTQAMIPNRISTLNKDFFHTAEQYTSRKIQMKAEKSVLIVKIRTEHRTVGDRQYNDGKQWKHDISLIYQRCPLQDSDQTQWFLMQQCLHPTFCPCRFCPHSCAGTCLHCRGSQQSWFPLCLHECLADLVRCQNSKFHLEV